MFLVGHQNTVEGLCLVRSQAQDKDADRKITLAEFIETEGGEWYCRAALSCYVVSSGCRMMRGPGQLF